MKGPTPVEFYNRYSGKREIEAIYGDRWLRWTYDTSAGRFLLKVLIRRAIFSRWYGWLMDLPGSRRRVPAFIEKYGIDTGELRDAPEAYRTFNEFFYRKLRPEARPVDAEEAAAVFPADGRHLAIPDLSRAPGFVAKGQRFELDSFLQERELAERYREGGALVSRLCPVDYHRFHFPVGGEASACRWIDGWLYSVNPVALRRNIRYLLENKRCYCEIDSARFGRVLQVEIGATCVGGIVQTCRPGAVAKGGEKGYFRFGGSCVVLLFEKGRVRFEQDLLENSAQYLETYGKMGDRMGTAIA